MFKLAKPLFLICETPLHAGSGDSLGVVDLPIQRERHTGFPKIEASSLKGALRESFEVKIEDRKNKNLFSDVYSLFGPEDDDAKLNPRSGSLAFTDARLLFFPVKSVKGVYAYVTCPLILEKFIKELKLSIPEMKDIPNIQFSESKRTKTSSLIVSGDKIILEEYTYEVKVDDNLSTFAKWISEKLFNTPEQKYWKDKLTNDLVVLSNDDFKDIVNLFTEVITRTKINNETGTVETGALFTEEFLPQESILYSLVMASNEFIENGKKANEMMSNFESGLQSVFQLGGNSTLGKGLLRRVF
ncbi:MAG TPA: type III-B CRISPR module RAMP protein Cmr4 [Leptospiraceae bacterium]|nr:type III-B CRISPR module RAMP protein Cmr4 [Leptospiraceae bacterium]HMX34275.1 type III-B CRISPR module RAMP protein Cmr4 [Leptospiraceae bacterium]HMY32696.1 type III-B CRISPR module RAMP protein Cmr4 [Leptospiraceae bacterium]HMZ64886.1 type III-B CRISPR module RAMP protein Cmr4 [Leptospiraceae bacterium]HNA05385.1 type III-B CRISPR module RAMP protein Cmr4 [Leptospiraceae bacterium]